MAHFKWITTTQPVKGIHIRVECLCVIHKNCFSSLRNTGMATDQKIPRSLAKFKYFWTSGITCLPWNQMLAFQERAHSLRIFWRNPMIHAPLKRDFRVLQSPRWIFYLITSFLSFCWKQISYKCWAISVHRKKPEDWLLKEPQSTSNCWLVLEPGEFLSECPCSHLSTEHNLRWLGR